MSHVNRYGFQNTIPLMAGIYPGLTLIMVYVCFFKRSIQLPMVQKILQWISAAYLLYLVYEMWNQKELEETDPQMLSMKGGFLLQFRNPKIGVTTALTDVLTHYKNQLVPPAFAPQMSGVPMMANFL